MTTNPAIEAWRGLKPEAPAPTGASLLSKKRKSVVYRLEGVDGHASVIAKRCGRESGLLERTLYEDVLARLDIDVIRFHGSVEEPGGGAWWLFVEEATGETYSSLDADHRRAAGRWLGAVHSAAAHLTGAVDLPDRGSGHYRDHLLSLRERIAKVRELSVLESRHSKVLDRIDSLSRSVDERWSDVVDLGARLPRTLVHGDLSSKNVRVRTSQVESTLLPFDWENAGWGVPAADLAQLRIPPRDHLSLRPDLESYWLVVRRGWPHLTLVDVERLAAVGTLFRLIALMDWASWSLRGSRPGKAVRTLRFYEEPFELVSRELLAG